MKLFISLMLFANIIWANIQIDYVDLARAKIVRNIFLNKYNLPMELLVLRKVDGCKLPANTSTIAHLCINKKGELIMLSQNIQIIKNSLTVFSSKGL